MLAGVAAVVAVAVFVAAAAAVVVVVVERAVAELAGLLAAGSLVAAADAAVFVGPVLEQLVIAAAESHHVSKVMNPKAAKRIIKVGNTY